MEIVFPRIPVVPASAPFRITYSVGRPDSLLANKDSHILAALSFSARSRVGHDPRDLCLGIHQLGGENAVEVWQSPLPVIWGSVDGIGYCHNEEVLFGHLLLEEPSLTPLQSIVRGAYARVLRFLSERGYPHVLRMWNFVSDINKGAGDLERYKQFCLGRSLAFEGRSAFMNSPPTASCVGTDGPGFLVYFIAARTPGLQVENPRQVSAYRYPREYGPKSPAFSRATLASWRDEIDLYIAGTSSIVGHQTRHPHNAALQLEETVHNLNALMARASCKSDAPAEGRVSDLSLLRAYIRDPAHLAMVRERLSELVGPAVPTVYLKSDICRRELLLEFEGVWRRPRLEQG